MKSRCRQRRPQDISTQPLRVSKRIAEQRPWQVATTIGTLQTKQSICTETQWRKVLSLKGERTLQKKTAPSKWSQQSRKKKVTRTSISRKALKEHEERTANEPLPEDLAKWKPDIVFLDSHETPSIHDSLMPVKLAECGVFDEKWDKHAKEIEELHNFQAVKSQIISTRSIREDQEKDIIEYKEWFETISSPSYSEGDAATWCKSYLNIGPYRMDKPHFKAEKMKFEAPTNSQILEYTPEPDYTEGIALDEMPSWIIDRLGCNVRPGSEMAMPNFMAEFKGKGSIQIAHQQARLDGGVAAQGYFRLLTLCNVGEDPFDKAFVGTIESNAETMIGNVHWATRSRDKSRHVEYHMRRVFHHFTRGITRRDFLRCREQARQFRQHFQNVRDDILVKLHKLTATSPEARLYSSFNLEHSKTLLDEEKLSTSGNRPGLVKRLKHHSAGRAIASAPTNRSRSSKKFLLKNVT